MSAGLALLAAALGAVGFGAVEVAGRAVGVLTALTPHMWLDALVYAAATLLAAWLFAGAFRGARRWALTGLVLGFVLSFAPLAGLLGAAARLTVDGEWGAPALVRSAFVNTPLNLVFALTLDVGFVALPLGLLAAGLIAWRARRARR